MVKILENSLVIWELATLYPRPSRSGDRQGAVDRGKRREEEMEGAAIIYETQRLEQKIVFYERIACHLFKAICKVHDVDFANFICRPHRLRFTAKFMCSLERTDLSALLYYSILISLYLILSLCLYVILSFVVSIELAGTVCVTYVLCSPLTFLRGNRKRSLCLVGSCLHFPFSFSYFCILWQNKW